MRKTTLRNALIVVGIPVLYAFILTLLFGLKDLGNFLSIMSISFLIYLPTIVGILTVFLSKDEQVKRFSYRFFAPWIPIFVFFILTLIISLEGWACWLMVLPFFLFAASIGGLIGGYLKTRKNSSKTYLSLLVVLPLVTAPIETYIGTHQKVFVANTFIDINAPASKIWRNVTRVRTISKDEDKGWLTRFLGLPRPVDAILNYEGVGGSREARFTGGLVFHEVVTEYVAGKKMLFTFKAYPYEIPSTTLDEHVVIGGAYFDVLNGTYELEPLTDHTCRLHLYSHFVLKTNFNWYAGWWAKWIMKDIQNNILQVERYRSENE